MFRSADYFAVQGSNYRQEKSIRNFIFENLKEISVLKSGNTVCEKNKMAVVSEVVS